MLLDGVHIPLLTPFYPDGRLYVRKLEHNVRRYSLTPVSGLAALTSVSETESLSDAERRTVLETMGREAAREKVLLAGVGLPGVRETLALAQAAAESGFDAVMVQARPAYPQVRLQNGAATPELQTYFAAVADGSPLPVILVSGATERMLPLDLVERLSSHPNVLGMLEQSSHISRLTQVLERTEGVRRTLTVTPTFTAATGRMLRQAAPDTGSNGTFVSADSLSGGAALATAAPVPTLKTRTRQVGFQLLWGSAADATEALRAGANGLLQPIAAAVPQAAFEVWAAYKDGSHSIIAEKQGRLAAAEQEIASWDIAALKAASELSGYAGGRPRLPLLPVLAERQREIADMLRTMRA